MQIFARRRAVGQSRSITDIFARGDDGLTVIMGQPGVQFARPVHYPVAQSFYDGDLAGSNQVIDLNGDRHPDFVAIGPGSLFITYGKADGTFISGSVYEAGYLRVSLFHQSHRRWHCRTRWELSLDGDLPG